MCRSRGCGLQNIPVVWRNRCCEQMPPPFSPQVFGLEALFAAGAAAEAQEGIYPALDNNIDLSMAAAPKAHPVKGPLPGGVTTSQTETKDDTRTLDVVEIKS